MTTMSVNKCQLTCQQQSITFRDKDSITFSNKKINKKKRMNLWIVQTPCCFHDLRLIRWSSHDWWREGEYKSLLYSNILIILPSCHIIITWLSAVSAVVNPGNIIVVMYPPFKQKGPVGLMCTGLAFWGNDLRSTSPGRLHRHCLANE